MYRNASPLQAVGLKPMFGNGTPCKALWNHIGSIGHHLGVVVGSRLGFILANHVGFVLAPWWAPLGSPWPHHGSVACSMVWSCGCRRQSLPNQRKGVGSHCEQALDIVLLVLPLFDVASANGTAKVIRVSSCVARPSICKMLMNVASSTL